MQRSGRRGEARGRARARPRRRPGAPAGRGRRRRRARVWMRVISSETIQTPCMCAPTGPRGASASTWRRDPAEHRQQSAISRARDAPRAPAESVGVDAMNRRGSG
jgi:hypothetical protein